MDEQKKKILIVDDDKFLLDIYAAKFRQEDFEVLTAPDGQEAWDMISNGQIPDILFTGIDMPRMSGFDLLAKVKGDPKIASISVVIFSHRGRTEDQMKAKELGAKDFLVQGLTTPNEMVRRIRLILGGQIFTVSINTDELDGDLLFDFLNKQQNTNCDFSKTGRGILKFIPESEKGKFSIELICKPEQSKPE